MRLDDSIQARDPVAAPLIPAPLLVLGAVLSVQFGQSFGKQLFGALGPAGVVGLRLGLAALVLLAVWRPRPVGGRSLGVVLALGSAIAGMNLIYPALTMLPVGVASTLQLLGPLTVALLGSRRLLDGCWAGLAGLGLLLFLNPDTDAGRLPVLGVVLALLSGASMGGYVLLSRLAGRRFSDGSPLALAVAWAAVLTLPLGVIESGSRLLVPSTLLTGLVVAVLSAVLPYSLELAALRRLPARVVGVLQTLEPAVGTVAGFLVLGERLTGTQLLALGAVTAGSVGSVLTGRRAASC